MTQGFFSRYMGRISSRETQADELAAVDGPSLARRSKIAIASRSGAFGHIMDTQQKKNSGITKEKFQVAGLSVLGVACAISAVLFFFGEAWVVGSALGFVFLCSLGIISAVWRRIRAFKGE